MSDETGPLASAREELNALVAAVERREDAARLGIVVEDVVTGERFAWRPDEAFNAASVIKVPILLAALRAAEDGDLDLDERVPVPAESHVGGSGVLKELPSLDRLSVRDLLTLMIIVSDNSATNLVLDHLGIPPVNRLLDDAGLTTTRLGRKLMDTEARARGEENVITAADVAVLFAGLVRRDLLTDASSKTALDVLGRQQINDKLPRDLPSEVPFAHKTGELSGVRHDAGVLFLGRRHERPVVAVVLTEGFTDPVSVADTSGGDAGNVGARVGRVVYSAYQD